MPKVARSIVEKRPDDIVSACTELYRTMSFNDIGFGEISKAAGISRPSIYNYFQSKEEIFLAILQKEYVLWCNALKRARNECAEKSAEWFAERFANALEERELLLKIQCMNLYEIEDNSRMERLVEFKRHYSEARELVDSCLRTCFPELSEGKRSGFSRAFFPFMNGIYPYVYPTLKQREAMLQVGIDSPPTTIYAMTKEFVEHLLAALTKEEA